MIKARNVFLYPKHVDTLRIKFNFKHVISRKMFFPGKVKPNQIIKVFKNSAKNPNFKSKTKSEK